MKRLVAVFAFCFALSIFAADAQKDEQLPPATEKNDSDDDSPNAAADAKLAPQVLSEVKKARVRMQEDVKSLGRFEVMTMNKLYFEAVNLSDLDDRKDALKRFLAKYKKTNRTGCAMLALATISKGNERIKILQDAIKDYSDCYFNDGAQVGGCGRYMLANTYFRNGDKGKAGKILLEIKKSYPDAINHAGGKLVDAMDDDFGPKFVRGLK